mmetsp:Transcript_42218/g.62519  ORF Transcript_42218/g.62519 Transcript_42218/m.62519 type:complete len:86 (+) Transcript_42218:3-260(+)
MTSNEGNSKFSLYSRFVSHCESVRMFSQVWPYFDLSVPGNLKETPSVKEDAEFYISFLSVVVSFPGDAFVGLVAPSTDFESLQSR